MRKQNLSTLNPSPYYENIIGKNNPNYLSCQNNLAILYQEIGQYSKAEYHYIESKEIREKVFGNKHFEYAASLNNIANFYLKLVILKKQKYSS
ncbi:MAG: tetratricopeptide repeat protein [Saprospiraceae bacterium]|nr:tetratricopeptide repeat protein [Candidatus Vicinibacter affinis]